MSRMVHTVDRHRLTHKAARNLRDRAPHAERSDTSRSTGLHRTDVPAPVARDVSDRADEGERSDTSRSTGLHPADAPAQANRAPCRAFLLNISPVPFRFHVPLPWKRSKPQQRRFVIHEAICQSPCFHLEPCIPMEGQAIEQMIPVHRGNSPA